LIFWRKYWWPDVNLHIRSLDFLDFMFFFRRIFYWVDEMIITDRQRFERKFFCVMIINDNLCGLTLATISRLHITLNIDFNGYNIQNFQPY